MRTIKFRLVKDNKIDSIQELKPNGIIDCPVEWDIACQFTGLLDKQGKEIYEGDIIRAKFHYSEDDERKPPKNEEVFEVKYKIDPCSQYCGFSFFPSCFETIEVIGNIYENPELLEEK